jgi:5-methylcytosine-specific restriction protein A
VKRSELHRNVALKRRGSLKPKRRTDPELQMLRPLLRARSQGRCEVQGWDRCQRQATQVHHRKRRSQGGTHDLSNLLDCCFACHALIHMSGQRAYDNGWLVRSGDNPAEIPVRTGP